MTPKEALDKFGHDYIASVRDNSIDSIKSMVEGRSKTYREITATYSTEVLEGLLALTPFIVDKVIAHSLGFFEEQEQVRILMPGVSDLARLSDGLEGELYGANGWIARFSKHEVPESEV